MRSKKVTIHDVAQASGVSIGAVSRILSKDPKLNVKDETRESVLRAITALGYSPNPHARGLRLSRSGSLAMIAPEIYSPAFPATIKGAHEAARQRGYSLLLSGIGQEGENPDLAHQLVEQNRVDGLLISTGQREQEVLANVKALKAPVVLLNRYIDDSVPYVLLDDVSGAIALVDYLLELGHTRIGFLGALSRFLGSRRLTGYKTALKRVGIPFDPDLAIETGYDRAEGERGSRALMALEDPPTAIMTTNHLVAAGVMLSAVQAGLIVPKDISVASFYDSAVAELLTPELTSLRFPLEQLGYDACAMLIDIIEGVSSAPPGKVIPYDKVIARASTSNRK